MYNIVRYYAPHLKKRPRIIANNVSLEQAQKHCSDPKTQKDGKWFDGFEKI